MTRLSSRSVAAFAGVLALITCEVGTASAQGSGFPPPRFVHFKDQTQGALYMPDPAVYPNPTTAMIAVHRVNNRMHDDGISPLIDREMPKRGVIVLGLNTHSVNNEAAVDWEGQMPKDIKAAVEFLKKEIGAKTVVLLGGSGGGPNVAFYQALAEKGLSVCKGPNKIVECADDPELIGPPADAIVFRDTHPGNPMNRLRSANPAVLNEADAGTLDDSLNPFLEKNGYNPRGCSSFSEEFKKRYFEGQSARMSKLVDQALKMKAEMAAGKHFPVDVPPSSPIATVLAWCSSTAPSTPRPTNPASLLRTMDRSSPKSSPRSGRACLGSRRPMRPTPSRSTSRSSHSSALAPSGRKTR